MKKKRADGVLLPVVKPHGGVNVSHNKNTAETETVRIPDPGRVILPMRQHIGAPCTPVVKVGDNVRAGQLVGDSDQFISAPIHSSISGKVTAITEIELPSNIKTQAVVIESDGEMRLADTVLPPEVSSREELIRAVRASGLVGLGGAGFPTHVKLSFSPDKGVDTLIVNAAECEPFITTDYRECMENSWDILNGVYTLQEFLGFEHVIIAVEDNKPEAFRVLKSIADKNLTNDGKVRLMVLRSRYPQGAEKVLIQAATGRRIPPGKLPSDVGCVVMNVGSVAFISRYLKTGKPLISRTLTVDGSAITQPRNVRVPIGTPIKDIVAFCGGYRSEPYKLITGGPMMGLALVDDELPVIKNNNAILAFEKDSFKIKKERACIRCGRCVTACPMNLMPTLIERFARIKDADSLGHIGVNVCMECGSCAYACPSGRPLVQYMRLAKSVVREAGDNK